MKELYNSQLILTVLNLYTKQGFVYDDVLEAYYSKEYEVVETSWYEFEVSARIYDSDIGGDNYFPLGQELSLADVINVIKKDQNKGVSNEKFKNKY